MKDAHVYYPVRKSVPRGASLADVHREHYEDWLVRIGRKDPISTNYVSSVDANLKRTQVLEFRAKTKNLPGYTDDMAYKYGAELGLAYHQK